MSEINEDQELNSGMAKERPICEGNSMRRCYTSLLCKALGCPYWGEGNVMPAAPVMLIDGPDGELIEEPIDEVIDGGKLVEVKLKKKKGKKTLLEYKLVA